MASGKSEKCLRKGSPEPGPVPKGYIRVYSMRFCPFAQRTRLVLNAKGIKHEVVNICLNDKPDWFLEKNPMGTVPVLETEKGDIVSESSVTCEFLDEVYGDPKLLPSCPVGRAKQKMMLECYSKFVQCLYKTAMGRNKGEDVSTSETELKTMLKKLDEKKKCEFFAGESVGMIDYMMWPWFEREKVFGLTPFLRDTPGLGEWIGRMKTVRAVKETMSSSDDHEAFTKSWHSGKPDYDYGLCK